MFSKNVCLKSKQSYTKSTNKEDEVSLIIQINSNHVVDKEVLAKLERDIMAIVIFEYKPVKDEKPKKN